MSTPRQLFYSRIAGGSMMLACGLFVEGLAVYRADAIPALAGVAPLIVGLFVFQLAFKRRGGST